MATLFGNTGDTSRRIIAATRIVERSGPPTNDPPTGPLGQQRQGWWAKITDNTAFTDNPNRWHYGHTEQLMTDDGWEDREGGIEFSSDDSDNAALNSVEANNPDTAGMMGNSVDTSATSTTLAPVRGSPVVWMSFGYVNVEGTVKVRYRFQYENSVDC